MAVIDDYDGDDNNDDDFEGVFSNDDEDDHLDGQQSFMRKKTGKGWAPGWFETEQILPTISDHHLIIFPPKDHQMFHHRGDQHWDRGHQ